MEVCFPQKYLQPPQCTDVSSELGGNKNVDFLAGFWAGTKTWNVCGSLRTSLGNNGLRYWNLHVRELDIPCPTKQGENYTCAHIHQHLMPSTWYKFAELKTKQWSRCRPPWPQGVMHSVSFAVHWMLCWFFKSTGLFDEFPALISPPFQPLGLYFTTFLCAS